MRGLAIGMGRARGRGPVLLGLLAGAIVAGCGGNALRVVGVANPPGDPPPARNAPAAAVRFLEWAMERRDVNSYGLLFTDDFRFYFDPGDSAGSFYRINPWSRTDEMQSALHLMVGGSATEEPASSISLDLIPMLYEQDTGDGLDPATHRRVTTPTFLEVRVGDYGTTVSGPEDFYLVHASVAHLPADVRARSGPDDWFIYAWADRTLPTGGGALSIQPITNKTWGGIKALYR